MTTSLATQSPVSGSRDLRIDFMRGVVMLVLVVAHIEVFSLYSLATWERVGFVAGAEGFVILAGFVVGMVYGARARKKGLQEATHGLVDRALQLYRVNVFVIVSIALLRAFTIADVSEVISFTDRAANITYPLFTDPNAPIQFHVADILLLRSGPHQMQILGLYVLLLGASPAALWLLGARRTDVLLLISWLLYVYNWAFPTKLTGAQFENAFPVLSWQLIYFHGMAAGFHRERVFAFMQTVRGRLVFAAAVLVAAVFLVMAQSTPNAFIPWWARAEFIPPEVFEPMHVNWFAKNELRPGRVLNYAAVLIVGYALLTRFWGALARAFGWFFIPLGQASLYVFIVHLYVVLLVSNVVPFGFTTDLPSILVNTVVHTVALAMLWLMVRYQVLFGWIPR